MQTMTVHSTSTQVPEFTSSAPESGNCSHALQSTTALADNTINPDSPNSSTQSLDAQKATLKKSTEQFNKMSDELNLDIKFAYNDKIDQIYLNVIDKNTGRVIRKLPSEEAMKISESMQELVGNLLDKKG